MPYTRRYNVEETLRRIQDLDLENSGSDGDAEVGGGNNDEDNNYMEVESAGSVSSGESDVEPLRKRLKVPSSHTRVSRDGFSDAANESDSDHEADAG